MKTSPIITVGIPTYQRPGLLDRALASVRAQSWKNLKIVVSDNASSGTAVLEVIAKHRSADPRIDAFFQSENLGPAGNFQFVREQRKGNLFIWLADDDYWPQQHLEVLHAAMSPETTMVFPDVDIVLDSKVIQANIMKPVYGRCRTDQDFLVAWSKHEGGFPIYGLYDVAKFDAAGLKFEFDNDLPYFSEGTFLQKLFLHGGIRFAGETSLLYQSGADAFHRLDRAGQVDAYLEYTKRVVAQYLRTDRLDESQRAKILTCVLKKHTSYAAILCGAAKPQKARRNLLRWTLNCVKSSRKLRRLLGRSV